MKSLFVTLLILGGLFAAYDYFLAPPWQRVIFEKSPPPAVAPALPAHPVEDDGPAPVAAPPVVEKKPSDDWRPTLPKVPSGEFVPPVIPTAEAVTRNWTQIPSQAFPRPVVLKKDTEVRMSVGASILRAGATAQAMAAEAGELIIAPTAGSQARGRVAVTDTDFPEQIRASYEKWKEARIQQARQAWAAAKTRVSTPGRDGSVLPDGQGIAFHPDGRPVQNADGSYNLLLAVISTGRVTDIDPKKVTHWSLPRSQEVDGRPTWIIDVTYPTQTLFGPMDVTCHAYIRDQQLLRWVYDSGEPVP